MGGLRRMHEETVVDGEVVLGADLQVWIQSGGVGVILVVVVAVVETALPE